MSDNKPKAKWVRSIFGDSVNAYNWYHYIPDGGINDQLSKWHNEHPDERGYEICSPSRLYTCPRVVWLATHGVDARNTMGWGKKQRNLLGRVIENLIASQLKDNGTLLWHWKDDFAGESEKFKSEDLKLEGTPDLLIDFDGVSTMSDSKSARSDAFGWQPIKFEEWIKDGYNKKYKVQLDTYYYLAHINPDWFKKKKLPLPEQNHLFTFALDDGIVKREFFWQPTKEDMLAVENYARRYQRALEASTMPPCTCKQEGLVKFCPYGDGDKVVATTCCSDSLVNQVKE